MALKINSEKFFVQNVVKNNFNKTHLINWKSQTRKNKLIHSNGLWIVISDKKVIHVQILVQIELFESFWKLSPDGGRSRLKERSPI